MENEDDQWVIQLRKGALELCMLALLAGQERYGYQLAQGLSDSAGLVVSEGTVYPLLSRLQREGLVESNWRESPNGPPRKYYRLTDGGRQVLESKTRAWDQFNQSVNQILEEARNGNHSG